MRLLVQGAGMTAGSRLHRALLGLARRGHHIGWVGGTPLQVHEGIVALEAREVAAHPWDVVVGEGSAASVASLGRRGAARAMVISVHAEALEKATWLDRMALDSLTTIVMIDESDEDAARGGTHGLALSRFGLWPIETPDERGTASSAETEVLERACERSAARSLGPAPRAALFVDRDGTLIVERGYLDDPDGVELLPGVATALREARSAGHPVVVVSNQAGVGRGRFSLERAHEVMASLRTRLRREGVELDAIHFCPHAPDEGCRCRKPGTLLFERAAEDLQIHLPHSVMVGDKRLDASAGQAAGMIGMLVRTGYGGAEEGATGVLPQRVHSSLPDAVRWFLDREEARVIG